MSAESVPVEYPRKWAARSLALLLAINLFNYIDRQILSATLQQIEFDGRIFRPDDPYLGTELGSLTTAFLLTYMLIAPVFGVLGDRVRRWRLIGTAIIAWSLASGGTGLAGSFAMLLLMRCLVGVGEAAYGPVAPSMLSDLYPVERRGRIMSYFYLAIPVGSALGFILGGQIAGREGGTWHDPFLLSAIPGVILGLLCFIMPEVPRRTSGTETRLSFGAVAKRLKKNRSWLLCTAGMTCSTFVLGGVAAWMPKYIFEREARFAVTESSLGKMRDLKISDGTPVFPEPVLQAADSIPKGHVRNLAEFKSELEQRLEKADYDLYAGRVAENSVAEGSLTLGKITFYFGLLIVVNGLIATLAGGWLGDKLRKRTKGAYFKVSAVPMFVSCPLMLAIVFLPFPWAWLAMFAMIFAVFFNTGPMNTVLANVVSSPMRSSAFALNILIIHLFGDAISPLLIGVVKDTISFDAAIGGTSFMLLASGVFWWMGASSLDEDTDNAEAV